MYILTVEDYFASAHQLREYKGKCENIHGHNWKVILNVYGDKLNAIGLLIDFGDMKRILKDVLQKLDHVNLNEVSPFDAINPSSENIAHHISESIEKRLQEEFPDVHVASVTVWESGTSRCTYVTHPAGFQTE